MLGVAAPLRRQGVKVIYTRDRDCRRYDGSTPRVPLA